MGPSIHSTRRLSIHRTLGILAMAFFVATTQLDAEETPQARIKRAALVTDCLDCSIRFFTEVVGFRLDSRGTLPGGQEPELGQLFNIDASKDIERALLSTRTEQRGLFLIEQAKMPDRKPSDINPVVLVIETDDLVALVERARAMDITTGAIVHGTAAEGFQFSEARIVSPAGHVLLVYQYDMQ